MEVDREDVLRAKFKQDIEDRIDLVFENYTLEEILEMNDLDEKRVFFILYTEGHINEPESYFP